MRYSNFDCSNDVVRKRFLAPSLVLLERVATVIVVSFRGLIQFCDQNPRPFHFEVNLPLSPPG